MTSISFRMLLARFIGFKLFEAMFLNIVSLSEYLIFGTNFHWISVVLRMQNYFGKS